MNFTEGPVYPNNTESSLLEKNGSSHLPIDIEILTLGPEIYWLYQGMMSVEGTLGIAGNLIALITVYKYEFLRENNGCRFIASLALADCFGGIGIFVSIARSVSRTIFRSVLFYKVPTGLNWCHTKIRMDVHGRIHPSFGMTLFRI